MPKTSTRFPVKASVLALAIMGLPHFAIAAGIGKLTVLSALGQPLRAEIEVSATKDELSSLAAKIATQEQFRQQGMDFNAAVASLNLSVEKRANGQPYVRMTSDRPINEPFLDVLVELSWASGRLVREYTFLLDPVELPRPASASVTAPGVTAVAAQAAPTVVETTKPAKQSKASKNVSAVKSEPTPKAEPAPKAEPVPKPAPAPKVEPAAPAPKLESSAATTSVTSREVKRGDTLGKIASETAPDGVSLDQMMVALFSANRDAFIGENINRLKTGRILNVPDREAATAVSDSEARKTIAIHAQNFNAYRQKLAEAAAGGAAVDAAPAQSSSGKITPKVEDKAPAPVAGKDKLEVSKNEASKAGAKAAAAAEEDKIAREKALKEAQSRVAELEKNVADLKKLNEVKSQSLAAAEKQAQAAKAAAPAAAPVVAAKPVEPVKPEPTKPVEVAKAEAPKVEPAKVEPTKAEEPKPAPAAEPAKPAEAEAPAVKPAEATPPPPPKKPVVVLPEPEPEPTFMEEFGPLVSLGGALLALLGGFFGYREWKRRKSMDLDASSQFSEASSTSSVFGTTGGQSVDTNNASLASSFSQTSLSGDEGTAGVDPVAEAEVYMAYGRDAQAEEILLEAIKAEPTRQAVHLKLLELYAARKSIKPFEEVARDLKEQTGGVGPNWDKAAALGQGIDPGNPLYSGAAKAGEGPDDTGAFGAFGTSTVIMPPGQLAKMAAEGFDPSKADTLVIDTAETTPVVEEAAVEAVEGFDLDLGSSEPSAEAPAPEAVTLDFDLDLGADDASSASNDVAALDLEVPSISPEPALAAPALDIEFDLDLPATTPAVEAPAAPVAGNSVDFEFSLDTPAAEADVEAAAVPEVGSLAPTVDFSSISLDLDTPAAVPEPEPVVDATPVIEIPSADGDDNPEVTTKLELAQAYEEMGDKEGMRELLQEVLAEGNAAQQELARNKLAEHGL